MAYIDNGSNASQFIPLLILVFLVRLRALLMDEDPFLDPNGAPVVG